MLRQIAAPLAAAARDSLNRGLTALVWTLAAVVLGMTGLGLLLTTAIMGLSRLTGPVWACGLMGLGLVLLAWLIITLRQKRLAPSAAALSTAAPPPAPSAVPPPAPTLAPDHLAFALGFVLSRLILSKDK